MEEVLSEDRTELNRRTEQFRGYLDSMRHRYSGVVGEDCTLQFTASPNFIETEEKGLFATIVGWLTPGRESEEQSEESEKHRIIQVMFNEDWFFMDLQFPMTLSAAEAKEISSKREGFSLASKDKDWELLNSVGEVSDASDALMKVYAYGQEREAAEDVAFVVFEIWKLPMDSPLYAWAESMSMAQRWEQGEAFE